MASRPLKLWLAAFNLVEAMSRRDGDGTRRWIARLKIEVVRTLAAVAAILKELKP